MTISEELKQCALDEGLPGAHLLTEAAAELDAKTKEIQRQDECSIAMSKALQSAQLQGASFKMELDAKTKAMDELVNDAGLVVREFATIGSNSIDRLAETLENANELLK